MGKKLPDNVHDLAWRIGFQNHSIPGTQRSDRSQRIRPPSRVDDRQRWMTLTQQVRDIDTVSLSWHVDVGDQQDERRGWVLDQGRSLVARLGLADLEALERQLVRDNRSDERLVLDEQNAHAQPPSVGIGSAPMSNQRKATRSQTVAQGSGQNGRRDGLFAAQSRDRLIQTRGKGPSDEPYRS